MENVNNEKVTMAQDDEGKIIRLSRERSLTAYYNNHLHKAIAAEINVRAFEKLDPEETVGVMQIDQTNGRPVMANIKAKKVVEQSKKDYDDNIRIVKVVEELLEEEKKGE